MAYQGTNKKSLQGAIQKHPKQHRNALADRTDLLPPPLLTKPAKPDPVRPDDLPLVSIVSSRAVMDSLIEIMQTNNQLAEEVYWMTKAIEENKKKATALLLEEGLVGVRHGSLYVRIGEEETKKTLDLGLIALHFGLDLDEVKEHCYKESKKFRKVFIDDLSRPKRLKSSEE